MTAQQGRLGTILMDLGRDHLTRVTAALCQEFGTSLDAVSIERVAAEEVALFDEARIRESVPLLAIRQARLRLQASASVEPGGGL
jgi:hypothetical protein